MDYKNKQRKYEERSNRVLARYDSGKRFSKSGEVRIKGVPYVKEENQKKKANKLFRKGKSE